MLWGTITGGYDIGRMDALKGSRITEVERPKEHLGQAMKTEDADTILTKIKYILDEIEDVAKASLELRTHFLGNLYEAKEKMCALKM